MTYSFEPAVDQSGAPQFVSLEFQPAEDLPAVPAEAAPPQEGSDPRASFIYLDEASEVEAPEDPGAALQALADAQARGREEGEREARRALEAPLATLARVIEALDEQRGPYLRAQREVVVDLAFALVEAWLGADAPVDRARSEALLDEALAAAPEDEGIVIELNPAEAEALLAADAEGIAERLAERGAELQPAAGLAAGEVRIHCGLGRVERMRDELLSAARQAFLECVPEVEA